MHVVAARPGTELALRWLLDVRRSLAAMPRDDGLSPVLLLLQQPHKIVEVDSDFVQDLLTARDLDSKDAQGHDRLWHASRSECTSTRSMALDHLAPVALSETLPRLLDERAPAEEIVAAADAVDAWEKCQGAMTMGAICIDDLMKWYEENIKPVQGFIAHMLRLGRADVLAALIANERFRILTDGSQHDWEHIVQDSTVAPVHRQFQAIMWERGYGRDNQEAMARALEQAEAKRDELLEAVPDPIGEAFWIKTLAQCPMDARVRFAPLLATYDCFQRAKREAEEVLRSSNACEVSRRLTTETAMDEADLIRDLTKHRIDFAARLAALDVVASELGVPLKTMFHASHCHGHLWSPKALAQMLEACISSGRIQVMRFLIVDVASYDVDLRNLLTLCVYKSKYEVFEWLFELVVEHRVFDVSDREFSKSLWSDIIVALEEKTGDVDPAGPGTLRILRFVTAREDVPLPESLEETRLGRYRPESRHRYMALVEYLLSRGVARGKHIVRLHRGDGDEWLADLKWFGENARVDVRKYLSANPEPAMAKLLGEQKVRIALTDAIVRGEAPLPSEASGVNIHGLFDSHGRSLAEAARADAPTSVRAELAARGLFSGPPLWSYDIDDEAFLAEG